MSDLAGPSPPRSAAKCDQSAESAANQERGPLAERCPAAAEEQRVNLERGYSNRRGTLKYATARRGS